MLWFHEYDDLDVEVGELAGVTWGFKKEGGGDGDGGVKMEMGVEIGVEMEMDMGGKDGKGGMKDVMGRVKKVEPVQHVQVKLEDVDVHV